jgi:hypothetical protein
MVTVERRAALKNSKGGWRNPKDLPPHLLYPPGVSVCLVCARTRVSPSSVRPSGYRYSRAVFHVE